MNNKGGTKLTSALQRAVLRDEDVDKAYKWLWKKLDETTRLEDFKKGFEKKRGEQWLGNGRAGLMTREEATDLLRAVRQVSSCCQLMTVGTSDGRLSQLGLVLYPAVGGATAPCWPEEGHVSCIARRPGDVAGGG